jgi:hypothetical protein
VALNNFIPAIWSQTLLENLRNNLVYGQPGIINRDYEGEISGAGLRQDSQHRCRDGQ